VALVVRGGRGDAQSMGAKNLPRPLAALAGHPSATQGREKLLLKIHQAAHACAPQRPPTIAREGVGSATLRACGASPSPHHSGRECKHPSPVRADPCIHHTPRRPGLGPAQGGGHSCGQATARGRLDRRPSSSRPGPPGKQGIEPSRTPHPPARPLCLKQDSKTRHDHQPAPPPIQPTRPRPPAPQGACWLDANPSAPVSTSDRRWNKRRQSGRRPPALKPINPSDERQTRLECPLIPSPTHQLALVPEAGLQEIVEGPRLAVGAGAAVGDDLAEGEGKAFTSSIGVNWGRRSASGWVGGLVGDCVGDCE
jgi:hypothetical protein